MSVHVAEARNLAARLRSTHCEPGTDPDAYAAADMIDHLLRECASRQARLEHVRAVRSHIETAMPDHPGGTDQDNGRWMAYDDVRDRLDEALDGVAW